MAEVIYGFSNGSGSSSDYDYVPNAWDEIDTSYAESSVPKDSPYGEPMSAKTNTCPGTNLGSISIVEIGMRGYCEASAVHLALTPMFGGSSYGTEIEMPYDNTPGTEWVDVTTDTNAPTTWDWSDIQNLDIRARNNNIGIFYSRIVRIYEFYIKVTYTLLDTGLALNLGINL